ncbi:hypothetical protein EVAR_61116_1 [Eumeta japonica]|uniref:Uncharacterized protein n=1 Tax=Eumeta variegata TaxID=151549 RepID=A0A4C1ZIH2_EUMVA|nr:hypothetical protein EVAR_61116_1 [Eumeta japonica]
MRDFELRYPKAIECELKTADDRCRYCHDNVRANVPNIENRFISISVVGKSIFNILIFIKYEFSDKAQDDLFHLSPEDLAASRNPGRGIKRREHRMASYHISRGR